MSVDVDVAIVGGGVIGRAIAYVLGRRGRRSVVVIERCPRDRIEIHAGIYYKPASRPKKARLCVAGNRMLYEFCAEHGVPHARTGKLVVATCAREEEYLRDVLETARANGVPDVRLIEPDEQRRIEPRIVSTAALLVPTSGVIDAAAYLDTLRLRAGSHDLFETQVEAIRSCAGGFELHTRSQGRTERFVAATVVNAAGLHAAEIARMVDPASPYELMPVRGEAARFSTSRRPELALRGLNIYPAPHGFYRDTGELAEVSLAEFQRLVAEERVTDTVGIHLTPTLDAGGRISTTMTLSPALVVGVARDDFRSTVPLEHYWKRVKAFFPELRIDDLELHHTGIQGRLPGSRDWVIEPARGHPRFIDLIAIDSPGLTSSLAIAEHVVDDLLA